MKDSNSNERFFRCDIKEEKERKSSQSIFLNAPPSVDVVFGQPRVIFARRDGFESRAPLSTNPLPFITGGAAAIRRACVTENTRPPEIYFIPALALDGRPFRHGTRRGCVVARNRGEEPGFQEIPFTPRRYYASLTARVRSLLAADRSSS